MAVLKSIGFETGNFSECSGTSGVPVVQTGTVYSGVYAAQLALNDVITYLPTNLATLGAQLWFRMSALPSGGDPRYWGILGLWNGSSLEHWNVDSSGHLVLESALALTGSATGTYTLAANAWYELSFSYDIAAGGAIKAWARSQAEYVAGTPATLDLQPTHASAGTNLVEASSRYGVAAAGNALYFDSFILTDTATMPLSDASAIPLMHTRPFPYKPSSSRTRR